MIWKFIFWYFRTNEMKIYLFPFFYTDVGQFEFMQRSDAIIFFVGWKELSWAYNSPVGEVILLKVASNLKILFILVMFTCHHQCQSDAIYMESNYLYTLIEMVVYMQLLSLKGLVHSASNKELFAVLSCSYFCLMVFNELLSDRGTKGRKITFILHIKAL